MKKKASQIILFGVHDPLANEIEWHKRFPRQWSDPGQPRLILFAGKPDYDIRPRMTLRFKDKNKPIFASNWHESAFLQVYDSKAGVKATMVSYFKAIGAENLAIPGFPGSMVTYCGFPIPASQSKKMRGEMIGLPHPVKPDYDNIVKFYMDVLQTPLVPTDMGDISLLPTDQRIATGLVHKFYADIPGVMVYYHPVCDRQALISGMKAGRIFKSYACPDLFGPVEGVVHPVARP